MLTKKRFRRLDAQNKIVQKHDIDDLVYYFSNVIQREFSTDQEQGKGESLTETYASLLTHFYATYINTILSGLSADYSIVQDILASQKLNGNTAAFKVINSGQISSVVKTFIQSKLRDLEGRAINNVGVEGVNVEMTIRALAFLSPPGSGKTQGITSTLRSLLKSERNPGGVIKEFLVYDLNRHNPVTAPLAGIVPVQNNVIIENLVVEKNQQSIVPRFDKTLVERIPGLVELATSDFFQTVIQTHKPYMPSDRYGNKLVGTNDFIKILFEPEFKQKDYETTVSILLEYIDRVQSSLVGIDKSNKINALTHIVGKLAENADVVDFILAVRLSISYILFSVVLSHVYMSGADNKGISRYYNIHFLNAMFKVSMILSLVIIAYIIHGGHDKQSVLSLSRRIVSNLRKLLDSFDRHLHGLRSVEDIDEAVLSELNIAGSDIHSNGREGLSMAYVIQKTLIENTGIVDSAELENVLMFAETNYGVENPTFGQILRGSYGIIENIVLYCVGNNTGSANTFSRIHQKAYSKQQKSEDLIYDINYYSSHIDKIVDAARFFSDTLNTGSVAAIQSQINSVVDSFRKVIGRPVSRNAENDLAVFVETVYDIINLQDEKVFEKLDSINSISSKYYNSSLSYFSKDILNKSLLNADILTTGGNIRRDPISDDEVFRIHRNLVIHMLRVLGIVNDEVYVEAVDSRLPLVIEDLLARARRDLETYYNSLRQGKKIDFPLYVIFFDEILTHMTPINFGIFQSIWTSLIESGKDKFPLNVAVILAGNMSNNPSLMKAILRRDSEGIKSVLDNARTQTGASADAFGALSDRLNFYLVTYDYSYLMRHRYDGYTPLGKQIGDYLENKAASMRNIGKYDSDIKPDFDASLAGNFDYYKAVVSKRLSNISELDKIKLEIMISSFLLGPTYRSIYKDVFMLYKKELLASRADGEREYNDFEKRVNMMIDVLHGRATGELTKYIRGRYRTIWSQFLKFLRENPEWRDAYTKMYTIAISPAVLYLSTAHTLAEYNNAINDIVDSFTEQRSANDNEMARALALIVYSILIINGKAALFKYEQDQISKFVIDKTSEYLGNRSYGRVIEGLLIGYAAVLFANYLTTMSSYNPDIIHTFSYLYEVIASNLKDREMEWIKNRLDAIILSASPDNINYWAPCKLLANEAVKLCIGYNELSADIGRVDFSYVVINNLELNKAVKALIILSMISLINTYDDTIQLKSQQQTDSLIFLKYITALYLALFKGITLEDRDGSAVIPGLRNMTTWFSVVDNSVHGYIMSMLLLATVLRYKSDTEDDILGQFLNTELSNNTDIDIALSDLKNLLITYSSAVFRNFSNNENYDPAFYDMISIERGVLANIGMPVTTYYGANAYNIIRSIQCVHNIYNKGGGNVLKELDRLHEFIRSVIEKLSQDSSGCSFDHIHLLAAVEAEKAQSFDNSAFYLASMTPNEVFTNKYALDSLLKTPDFKHYMGMLFSNFALLGDIVKNGAPDMWPEWEKLINEAKNLSEKIKSLNEISAEHFIESTREAVVSHNIPDGIFEKLEKVKDKYVSVKEYVDAWRGPEKEKIIRFYNNIIQYIKIRGDYNTASTITETMAWIDKARLLIARSIDDIVKTNKMEKDIQMSIKTLDSNEIKVSVTLKDLVASVKKLASLPDVLRDFTLNNTELNKFERQIELITTNLLNMAVLNQLIWLSYLAHKGLISNAASFVEKATIDLGIYLKGDTTDIDSPMAELLEAINKDVRKNTTNDISLIQTSNDSKHLVNLCFDNHFGTKPVIDSQDNSIVKRNILTKIIYKKGDKDALWIDMHHVPISGIKSLTGAIVPIKQDVMTVVNNEQPDVRHGVLSYYSIYQPYKSFIPRYLFSPSIIVHSTMAAGIYILREALNSSEDALYNNVYAAYLATSLYLYYKKTAEAHVEAMLEDYRRVEVFFNMILDPGNNIPLHPFIAELIDYYNYNVEALKNKLEKDYGSTEGTVSESTTYSNYMNMQRLFSSSLNYEVIPAMYSIMEPAVKIITDVTPRETNI